MVKSKFSFNDIKIGDTILTTNNKIGEVIALKSYAYLNDKFDKKSKKPEEVDTNSFNFDNNRHNGIWYSAVTVAIEDTTKDVPSYYTEKLDFIEIKDIIKHNKDKKTDSLKDKLEKIFKI